MIYTLSREGGIDFSSIISDLKQHNIAVLDSDTLHQEQLKFKSGSEHFLDHFGEYSPRFLDLWSVHKDYYLSFLRLSIYRFALGGQGVIYGHGASCILSQLPAIMKIKLIGPEDYRIRLVAEKQKITEHEARTLIHKRERERIGFYRFFFDADWNEESCYDVILNVGANNFQNILETALDTPFPQEQIEKRDQKLRSLIFGEELYMDLLFEQKWFIDLLKIQCDLENKQILLTGIIDNPKTQQNALLYVSEKYPDFAIEVQFELMQNSYLYFPSV